MKKNDLAKRYNRYHRSIWTPHALKREGRSTSTAAGASGAIDAADDRPLRSGAIQDVGTAEYKDR